MPRAVLIVAALLAVASSWTVPAHAEAAQGFVCLVAPARNTASCETVKHRPVSAWLFYLPARRLGRPLPYDMIPLYPKSEVRVYH